MPLRSVEWTGDGIRIINQNELPEKLVYEDLKSLEDVKKAIVDMEVRGAPLLGVISALALALVARKLENRSRGDVLRELRRAGEELLKTRPTAVNIKWAVRRVLSGIERAEDVVSEVLSRALSVMREDEEANLRIAEVGEELLEDGDRVLTHCNTGSLATTYYGTALGMIFRAHEKGKKLKVYATETRPRLQGARLTMFELMHEGIDSVLVPDTAVGLLMLRGMVDKVIVGADRILRDGTVFNKIGTYQIAALAERHGVPFYVAAPTSTFDLESRVGDVVIEERDEEEVLKIKGVRIAPEGARAFNPAFDMTPAELVTALITEVGVINRPFEVNISKVLGRSG